MQSGNFDNKRKKGVAILYHAQLKNCMLAVLAVVIKNPHLVERQPVFTMVTAELDVP